MAEQPKLASQAALPPKPPAEVKDRCKQCGSLISVPFPPILTFEGIVASTVVIPHSQGIECANCGVYHNIVISPNTVVALMLIPCQKPDLVEDKKIITPHLNRIPTGQVIY